MTWPFGSNGSRIWGWIQDLMKRLPEADEEIVECTECGTPTDAGPTGLCRRCYRDRAG